MLTLNNVSKRYPGGFDALKSINLHIQPADMVFLTGHSGAGKSTLLKLITRLERVSGGKIIVDGRNVTRMSERDVPRHRRGIGVIFQDNRLLPDRTVFDNVALPLVVDGWHPQRELKRMVRAALDKVGLLKREKSYPPNLSGGEQQRVGIARAIVNKPPLLLADEPTGNLDPELSSDIFSLFTEFQQVGMTILIASHDLALIEQFHRRCLRLEHGSLVDDHSSAATQPEQRDVENASQTG